MYKVVIFFALTTLLGCKEGGKYLLHLDKKDRPITGCLFVSKDAISALWISMKCQKSAMAGIQLCTEGRMLQEFDAKEDCQRQFETALSTSGPYSLKSDPFERN